MYKYIYECTLPNWLLIGCRNIITNIIIIIIIYTDNYNVKSTIIMFINMAIDLKLNVNIQMAIIQYTVYTIHNVLCTMYTVCTYMTNYYYQG